MSLNMLVYTWDAWTSIFALKLIGSASYIVASLWGFIRTIGTVFFAVAYPSLMDASNTIVAIELLVLTVAYLLPVLNILKGMNFKEISRNVGSVCNAILCKLYPIIFLSSVSMFLTLRKRFQLFGTWRD